MRSKVRLYLGIALDVVALAGGTLASFLAFWAWSEGTLPQFWQLRALLMMGPMLAVALLSAGALRDPPWRCWLRLMLFEALSLCLFFTVPVEHFGPGLRPSESALHFGLAPLVDAAIYVFALAGMNRLMRRRAQRDTAHRQSQDSHEARQSTADA